MNPASNIVSSVHHLKLAVEHWADFKREKPGSKGAHLFQSYINRVEWIANDLITHPALPQDVRDGIKAEWNSDVFALIAINEKIALLNPEQREMIEELLSCILKGETIQVEKL